MGGFNYRFIWVWWLVIILSFNNHNLFGQKNDYIWLSGYDSDVIVDSATYGFRYGTSVLNFNSTPLSISYDSLAMNFDRTNTSFCDGDGNLLFYSNGIYVANSLNQAIANSSGMNQGWLDEVWDPTIQTGGYRNSQGILVFQDIANPSYYYLIYSHTDSVPGTGGNLLYNPQILAAYLDMSANGGLGKAIYINQPLIAGNFEEEISAVRHGNGRDWWILAQNRGSNCYSGILLSDSGLKAFPNLTCGGEVISDSDYSADGFSPDGSKFAHFGMIAGLNIYDFDRCTGQLSNPIYYPLDIWKDSSWLGHGIAFSPNNRFLYVSATKVLLQFDLSAPNVLSSIDTVGVYDGYRLPVGSYFNTAQLGPDGKIYISCGNTEEDYHIISNPNYKGDSCNFIQHGLRLASLSAGQPNFPNYRLGALSGSACDTITGLNEVARAAKEQIIKVYPNPADDYVTIDYGFTDWNKGQPELEICNCIGQVVYNQQLPMYSGFQKIDVSRFAAGMYTVLIKRQGGVVASQKLVKN